MKEVKEVKLNWNGLTDKQQVFIDNIVNREVFTLCNELIEDEYDNYPNDILFDNCIDEETEEPKEIFCYFIVSEWLYKQLEKVGACITEFKGLYIWGRTDFGQGLNMNHELKQITKNIITIGDKNNG